MRPFNFILLSLLSLLILPVAATADEQKQDIAVTAERIEEFRSKTLQGEATDPEPASLMVMALLKGEPITGAVRFGELSFKATDDKGNELKMRENLIAPGEFARVDRTGKALEKSLPADTIRLELMMAAPPREATKIAKLEGSVKLLVGTPTQVIVQAPADKVNQEIQDPALKAAGVKVMLMSYNPKGGAGLGVYARFRVIGKEWAIVNMAALDAEGKVRSSGSGGGAGVGIVSSITYEIYGEDPLPEGSSLRLTVLKDVKHLTVPIELKDVPLP